MLKKTLEKIEGTVYAQTLNQKKHARKRLEDMGCTTDANAIRASIAGYLQAIRDFGIISESERQRLYIYFATI